MTCQLKSYLLFSPNTQTRTAIETAPTLAAIDIGSNAIRLVIVKPLLAGKVLHGFKKLEFIRFPLRLGYEVFADGHIGYRAEQKFFQLMQTFKMLLDLYEVEHYLAYATSAMRESRNGEEIVQRVYYNFGLKIQIIDGNQEAETLNQAIFPFIDDRNFIHVDVGGGSTEINLYVNRQKIAAQSFQMGSVRKLNLADRKQATDTINAWLKLETTGIDGEWVAIGTGGNINKLFDFCKEKEGNWTTLAQIIEARNYVKSFTVNERINKLEFNKDRADVIIPASEIYLNIFRFAAIQKILVPKVGLKEGMIGMAYHRWVSRK